MTSLLRCPRCRGEQTLELRSDLETEREVREGSLTCVRCGQSYPIAEGIVDLLYEPPEFVRREAAGLERFAEFMRNEGWDRERVLALPDVHLGYWADQGRAMRAMLAATELEPGRRLMDIGSNTCWASNIFARMGLEVIAVDIAKTELQGLRTAEYFLDQGVYFERLLSLMFDLALASESVDYVFCSEVLHHNDLSNLRRTLNELYRVLRPGGLLLVLNEPMRFPLRLKRDHGQEVAEFEGYEHVFFFHQYYGALRRAGFQVGVRTPAREDVYFPWPATPDREGGIRNSLGRGIASAVRQHRLSRRLMLAYKTLLVGDVPLHVVATKPNNLPA
jgi:SAM-dependent methyltransferase/uncharacterized protein YbaR (Trm112 family)